MKRSDRDPQAIEIGKRIKTARLSFDGGKGMTQKQLGQLCGINEANIRKYESGRQRPKYTTLEKIAKALKVAPGYLQGMNDEDVYDTLKSLHDYQTVSKNSDWIYKYVGLSPEDIGFLDSDYEIVRSDIPPEEEEKIKYFNQILATLVIQYDNLTNSDFKLLTSLTKAFCSINDTAKKKAAELIEDLAKIPEYQKSRNQS
ncbi:MAG: hypothetical protein ACFWUC_10670 [Oscillospiraceae bacterium]|jgi:transcriptional regulator with XRE-family HTH domain